MLKQEGKKGEDSTLTNWGALNSGVPEAGTGPGCVN